MDEYFEREAAIKAICDSDPYGVRRALGFRETDIEEALRSVPAADVAPVRHGLWAHEGPRFRGGVDWWRCSNCGSLASGVETKFRYCPHCGARMDGAE